ncbi:hypothetical protein L596_017755 [Steinernema carpocapsae]|uniref:Uncharacterized protein n=1 Tax=Steinernema carpocapsae TaxID=34508 RepID=A0A4U5N309_STECR|nr:hypothetical protein L596_017755 [Steinernema carpocapsae]
MRRRPQIDGRRFAAAATTTENARKIATAAAGGGEFVYREEWTRGEGGLKEDEIGKLLISKKKRAPAKERGVWREVKDCVWGIG